MHAKHEQLMAVQSTSLDDYSPVVAKQKNFRAISPSDRVRKCLRRRLRHRIDVESSTTTLRTSTA